METSNGEPATKPRSAPRRHRPEELLLKISAAVGSKLNLAGVLDTILQASMEEMRAQEGSILLRDDGRDRLEMLASRGLPEEMARRGHIPRKGSIAEWVLENDKPLILNGAVKGRRFKPAPGQRTISSAMCVPLRAEGRAIGTLNLNRTDAALGNFRAPDLRLMTLVGAHAAESIQIARLHEAVLQSERLAAVGQTISGVAHCIKNMLTSLKGGVSICQMAAERGELDDFLTGSGMLERAVNRVSSLALDMLEYSKDRRPVMMEVPLDELFRELIGLKSDVAEGRGVALASLISPGAETAWADGNQLFRCLLNLLDNALDACGTDGGEVTLSAEVDDSPAAMRRLRCKADRALVVRVADTGPGIPEEVAAHIFEPFFSTKGSKGTGLGLAVTRKILREHGGEIELESTPGEGAVFAIYLAAPESSPQQRA